MSAARASTALHRLQARAVMAATFHIVRGMQGGRRPAAIRRMMAERQRLLALLARDVNVRGDDGSLAALEAAVAESDRTLEALMRPSGRTTARESTCTRASIPSS